MTDRYEIRVRGHLGPVVAATFEGLLVRHDAADSVLSGPIVDQAALYGVIDKLEALGLELIEVRLAPPDASSS